MAEYIPPEEKPHQIDETLSDSSIFIDKENMKNLFKSPLSVVVTLVAAFLMGWMLLSAFGVLNNFWGWDARQAGWGWKIITVALVGGAAFLMYQVATDKREYTKGTNIVLFVMLAIAFSASTGFKFTGGDIKQRVTYLDNHGKVADKTILYKYYDDFYHFSTDTALKNYVEKYGELPGRNRWNTFILNGELAPSTAPRANEDFKWHTGVYEMK